MYENKIITEPKWKSWIVQTTTPLFTPDQCRQIIASGRAQKPQQAQVGMNKPGEQTEPLIKYYSEWAQSEELSVPSYVRVDGVGSVDEIRDHILNALA